MAHLSCGMKPGIPVFTTVLNLFLVWIRLIWSTAAAGIEEMQQNATRSQSPGPSLARGVRNWKLYALDIFKRGARSHSNFSVWMGEEIGQDWPQIFRIDSKNAQRAETGTNHFRVLIREAGNEYGQRGEPYGIGCNGIGILVKPRTCCFPDFPIRAVHCGQENWHNFVRVAAGGSQSHGCAASELNGGLRSQEHSAKLVRDHSGRGFEVREEERGSKGKFPALRVGYRVADRRKRPEGRKDPEGVAKEFLSPGRWLIVHPLQQKR